MANMDIPYLTIMLKVTVVSYPTSAVPYLEELRSLASRSDGVVAMHVLYYQEVTPVLLVLAVSARVIVFHLLDLTEAPLRSFSPTLWMKDDCKFVGYRIEHPEIFVPGKFIDISGLIFPRFQCLDDPKRNMLPGLWRLCSQVTGNEPLPMDWDEVLMNSNWAAAVLNRGQVQAVSSVAYLCYRIYCRLKLTQFRFKEDVIRHLFSDDYNED